MWLGSSLTARDAATDLEVHCIQLQLLLATGFKLDTLLKLADVKGTDRKTSLLHFVLEQLLKEIPSMKSLHHQLSTVKPASNIQVGLDNEAGFACYTP